MDRNTLRSIADASKREFVFTCDIQEADKLWWGTYRYNIVIHVGFEEHDSRKMETLNRVEAFLDSLNLRDSKCRMEGNTLSVYLCDEEPILGVIKHINDLRHDYYSDPNDSNSSPYVRAFKYFPIGIPDDVVRCNKLPHNKYQYRVFLDMKRIYDRKGLLEFIELQNRSSTQFRYPNATENSLRQSAPPIHATPRYLYVEDKKALLALAFRAGESLTKVERYEVKQ